MRKLEASDMLRLWELGITRHAIDRSALLVAWARPAMPAEGIADLPLGEVTASLLQVHAASFGERLHAQVDCERCGQRLELDLDAHALLQPAPATALPVEHAGFVLRPPSLRDLAAVAHERDAGRAARELLARCARTSTADAAALPEDMLREIEDALEAADPNADLAFEVRCEACDQRGTTQLDAAALLWDEIDARARALLEEVHRLATAYGWSEAEILGLSAARRAAYLSLVPG